MELIVFYLVVGVAWSVWMWLSDFDRRNFIIGFTVDHAEGHPDAETQLEHFYGREPGDRKRIEILFRCLHVLMVVAWPLMPFIVLAVWAIQKRRYR